MAYAVKYKFIFESINGAVTEIDVLKDGYSGSPIQRPLGSAPVLRQQKNDRVSGSSLAFSPECQVDGEFTEFYTTDPFQYKVNLYRANNLIWSGFITPELYSEPDIAPPYDVNVTATDGLGELRRTTFNPIGKVTLHALFVNLLSYTGQSLDVNYISRLGYSGVAYNAFFVNTYIDVDYKAGESCYDVLQYILTTFNAVICFYNGAWMIVRENDVTLTSGKPDYIKANGTAGTLTGGHMEIGSMTAPGKLWPVNFTSTAVDPALRRMAVEAPWNLVSGLLNSDMLSDASWTKSGSASYNAALGGYSLLPQAYIQQSITQKMGKPFLLTFDAAAYIYRPGNVQKYSQAIVEVKFVSGGSTWYAAEDENGGIYWNTEASNIKFRIESGDSRATATENQVNVPVATDSNGNVLTGTLTVKISADTAQGLRLFGAWLTIAAEKGWKDNIEIDNDARGDASDVTIAIGYETNDISDYKKYYGGILLTANDALVTSLSTQNFSNLDFLSLISRDFARSIASPRLRTTGTLNTPSSLALRPLLVTHRSSLCWLETFEWNLYMDDLAFAAVSVPTGTITVSGEVITATGSASGSAENTIGRLTPGSGEEAISVMLTNSAHIFSGNQTTAQAATDTTKAIAYKGTERKAVTIGTITGAPTGMTVSVTNNNTTEPTITISVTTSLTVGGSLTIPVTVDGITFNLSYAWAIAFKGANGQDGDDGDDGMTTAWVTIYKRQSGTPTLPRFNVTYNFANGTITGDLDGWSLLPPDTDSAHNPLWMATALAYGSGATASISRWNGPVKMVEDGSGGAGKTPRGPSVWSANGIQYQGVTGTGEFIDFVIDENDPDTIYYCLLDHTSSSDKGLNNGTYWAASSVQDFVATKVLFANYSFVQNLGANAVKISNTGGNGYGGFMPPQTDGNGNTIFWAGGASPATAKFTIDSEGNINAGGGNFSGRLVLPFVDMSSDKTLSTVNDSTHINASSIRILCAYSNYSGYVLTLPNSSNFNGWLLNVYVERRLSRTEMAGEIDGSILIPEKASYGVMAYYASRIIPEYGGYFSFVCVAGQWVLTSYNAASVTFQQ